MGDIKVSVLTITFNHEKFIAQTLDSFLSQKTDFDYEILIHDDASTDRTQDIIREYMEKYPNRIRAILQKENQFSKGVDVYNFLREMARGQYIATCEGDDYWCDDTKLQRQVDVLDQHPECIACVHQTLSLNCVTSEEKPVSRVKEDRKLRFSDIIQGGNLAYQMSSLLVRREYFIHEDKPEFLKVSKTNGDYPFALYLIFNGDIYFINREMSIYRYQSSPTAWTMTRKKRSQTMRHYKEMIEMLTLADQYSDGKYHEEIYKKVTSFEYALGKMNNDRKILSDKKYRSYLKQETAKERLKIYVKVFLPESIVSALQKGE